jgi:hypothetical protein
MPCENGRGAVRGFSLERIFKRQSSNASIGFRCELSRLSQARGVRPSQPFRKPKRPDRDKREKEKSNTRQECNCKTCVHDILPGEMIGCSLG